VRGMGEGTRSAGSWEKYRPSSGAAGYGRARIDRHFPTGAALRSRQDALRPESGGRLELALQQCARLQSNAPPKPSVRAVSTLPIHTPSRCRSTSQHSIRHLGWNCCLPRPANCGLCGQHSRWPCCGPRTRYPSSQRHMPGHASPFRAIDMSACNVGLGTMTDIGTCPGS
jgi:hypothetical protein